MTFRNIISFFLVSMYVHTTVLKCLNMLWSPDPQTAVYRCIHLKQTFIHACSLNIQIS